MSRRLIVNDLVAEVRDLIDENNTSNIDNTSSILPALNRGQDYVANILARHYEEPLLTYVSQAFTAGTYEYDIPADAFEQRVEKVEVALDSGQYEEVERISYRDISCYETSTVADVPDGYVVVGTKLRLVAPPSATYNGRVWYLKDPDPLVMSQGRVTSVSVASNYLILDELGDDLTVSDADLNCYIRVVNGTTGEIRGNYQIDSIDTTNNKVTLKSSVTRASVLGRTISGTLSSSITEDDHVCVIHGTCVPFIKKPFSNFVIHYAVNELKGIKLDETSELSVMLMRECEKQAERSWVGREQHLTVQNKSAIWSTTRRR